MSAWKDLCKEVLGYVPESKAGCLEDVVEKFVIPETYTCGVLYVQKSDKKIPRRFYRFGGEMPQRVVVDSNVLGCIVRKSSCNEFEYWKNCADLLRRIEDGRMEGKIIESTLEHVDRIIEKAKYVGSDVKELIRKTILAVPNLGIKSNPKLQTVRQNYADVISEYRLRVEDIDDLMVADAASKEGASIATYDSLLLTGIPELPKAFTPEEILGLKIPYEKCLKFCRYANNAERIVEAPLVTSH